MAEAAVSLSQGDDRRPKILLAGLDHGRRLGDVAVYLAGRGYDPWRVFARGRAGPAALPAGFDLVVIEVGGEGEQAIAFCRELAGHAFPAVIVVCEAMTAPSRVMCLELGADDVVAGPVGYRELAARISAVLRGRSRSSGRRPPRREWTLGGGSFNVIDRVVKSPSGASARLSEAESRLLAVFLDDRGAVLSREEITRRTGEEGPLCARVVDVHVARLRRRLERCEGLDWTIQTLRGVGYRFDADKVGRQPRRRSARAFLVGQKAAAHQG